MNLDEFEELKAEVEDAKGRAQRAHGQLDQLMATLKRDFDCKTLKEAKDTLAKTRAKLAAAQQTLDKGLDNYRKKWKVEEY